MSNRIDDGKANLAPRPDRAQWLKLEGVALGNGPLGTGGDSVAVVTAWRWPNPFAGVTEADLLAVQKAVAAGRWRENVQAHDWVGRAIAGVLELDLGKQADKAKVKGLLCGWIAEGALVVVTGKDGGKARKFVEVGKCVAG